MNDLRVVRISLESEEGQRLRKAHKLKPGVKEIVRLYCTGQAKTVMFPKGEEKQGVLITTPDQDRMGEIVDPKGVDLTHYMNNPVILWAHDYSTPPIGSAESIKVTDQGILAVPRWASTERAQEIKTLYDEGHMRAWSIGFIPKEWTDGNGEKGAPTRIYTKWELLEFSAVPVPANPYALSERIQQGLMVSKALQEELGLKVGDPPAKAADSSALADEAEGDTSSNDDSDLLAQMNAMLGEVESRLISYVDQAIAVHEATYHSGRALPPNGGVGGTTVVTDTKIRILNNTQPERVIPSPEAEPVLRVEGKLMTSSEVLALMQKSVDALMRKFTGRVS